MKEFTKNLFEDLKQIITNKAYMIITAITALLSYGFAITHCSPGIDDISMDLYLNKGMLPEVGRWTLFLINKIIHLTQFTPFIFDLLGLIILWISAALFCVLINRVARERVSLAGYVLFACFFLTCPLFSETDIYYLHNCSDLGWLLIALSLILSYDVINDPKKNIKQTVIKAVSAMLLLWIAVGCYESFMFVFFTALLFILLFEAFLKKEKLRFKKLLFTVLYGVICIGCTIILRALICKLLEIVFRFPNLLSDNVKTRSMGVILGELFSVDSLWSIKELFIDTIIKYRLNALLYLPVTLYAGALLILFVVCIVSAVKHKSIGYILIWLGVELIPFVQVYLQGYVFYYRSAQIVPLTIAFMAIMILSALDPSKKSGKILRGVLCAVYSVLIINCAVMLNHQFYLDRMRYDNDKWMMREMSEDIYRFAGENYGEELCVFFAGHMDVPDAFREGFYVSENDPRVLLIKKIVGVADPGLSTVHSRISNGKYYYDDEMTFSLYMWGKEAFDGTNKELMRFINMHGGNFTTIDDKDEITNAKWDADVLPAWPAEGSIVQRDGYILVHVFYGQDSE